MRESLLLLLSLILLSTALSSEETELNCFELVGLFTTTHSDPYIAQTYGIYPREAAKLAVQHVREEGLLAEHGFKPLFYTIETACDQTGALMANLEYIRDTDPDPNVPYAVVGPVCSIATNLLATISHRYINSVQVSYGVTSPEFSDVNAFSYFYSTVPALTAYKQPIQAILEHFDWQVIGMVVDSTELRFTLTAEALANFLTAQDSRYTTAATLNLFSHLGLEGRNLRGSVRIFIALVEVLNAADTLCAAFRSGLTGPDFVWILLDDYEEGWWRSPTLLDCTEEEMLQAVESTLILTNTVQIPPLNFNSIKGQDNAAFWEEYALFLKNNTGLNFTVERSLRVLQAYDAVWSITKALRTTLSQLNFTAPSQGNSDTMQLVSPSHVIGLHQALNRNMKNLSFEGTSGTIKFTKEFNSPQKPATSIFQMQNGIIVPVGVHMQNATGVLGNLDFSFFDSELIWQSGAPPRDRPVVVLQVVELWIILIALFLTALGIIYAIIILIVNCVYRKHKVIKASSPYMNILIIVGCVLGLLVIPVFSIENLDTDQVLPEAAYMVFCNIRIWMIVFALTLTFGALFAKTWRVYNIFKNPWVKARPYKDHVLLSMVGLLLLTDIIALGIGNWRNQLSLRTFTFPSQSAQFTQNTYRVCLSGEQFSDLPIDLIVWFVALSLMKLLLFLFGVFLVIQTRKVKARFFQDSKYIGISIYATCVVCGLGFPAISALLVNFIEDIGYAISASMILFCTFFILSMVFVPRFLLLKKYRKKVPTAVLLGLNPSFRVRRPLQGLENKKRALSVSLSNQSSLETTSTTALSPANGTIVSRLSNTSGSTDDLLSRIEETVWEPAYEEDTDGAIATVNDDDRKSGHPYSAFKSQISPINLSSQYHPEGDSFVSTASIAVEVH